jgi:hypothetical protein
MKIVTIFITLRTRPTCTSVFQGATFQEVSPSISTCVFCVPISATCNFHCYLFHWLAYSWGKLKASWFCLFVLNVKRKWNICLPIQIYDVTCIHVSTNLSFSVFVSKCCTNSSLLRNIHYIYQEKQQCIKKLWSTAGVDNLFITAGRTGYSYLCPGPQKKLITWTVSETVFL